MLDYRHYIWRGQRREDWRLESTLDRDLRKKGKLYSSAIRLDHLRQFKFAARGRRSANPPSLDNDNDWWALGQHNGLSTPLLDWTTSPFVAAFFAYCVTKPDDTPYRAVYSVSEPSIARKSAEIIKEAEKKKIVPRITEFFRPLSNENPRLVSQGGLFSKAPNGTDLESWIRQNFKGETNYILIKILLPTKDRLSALRSLNRMNINHLSLFPDLYGASEYCNFDLTIDKY